MLTHIQWGGQRLASLLGVLVDKLGNSVDKSVSKALHDREGAP